jgi:hypothetical protein
MASPAHGQTSRCPTQPVERTDNRKASPSPDLTMASSPHGEPSPWLPQHSPARPMATSARTNDREVPQGGSPTGSPRGWSPRRCILYSDHTAITYKTCKDGQFEQNMLLNKKLQKCVKVKKDCQREPRQHTGMLHYTPGGFLLGVPWGFPLEMTPRGHLRGPMEWVTLGFPRGVPKRAPLGGSPGEVLWRGPFGWSRGGPLGWVLQSGVPWGVP